MSLWASSGQRDAGCNRAHHIPSKVVSCYLLASFWVKSFPETWELSDTSKQLFLHRNDSKVKKVDYFIMAHFRILHFKTENSIGWSEYTQKWEQSKLGFDNLLLNNEWNTGVLCHKNHCSQLWNSTWHQQIQQVASADFKEMHTHSWRKEWCHFTCHHHTLVISSQSDRAVIKVYLRNFKMSSTLKTVEVAK